MESRYCRRTNPFHCILPSNSTANARHLKVKARLCLRHVCQYWCRRGWWKGEDEYLMGTKEKHTQSFYSSLTFFQRKVTEECLRASNPSLAIALLSDCHATENSLLSRCWVKFVSIPWPIGRKYFLLYVRTDTTSLHSGNDARKVPIGHGLPGCMYMC